jgi:DNA-binding NarL/FixJ family response regulator
VHLSYSTPFSNQAFSFMPALKILLADDHPIVREGLKTLILSQPDMQVVGEASDGLEACKQASQLQPDLVIMDISMPGLTGTQATERLSHECPKVKVLALTIHEDKGYIRQLLAAGAAGYVLKRVASEELVHAIRVVAAGKTYLDPDMAGKVVTGFVRRTGESLPTKGPSLSDRELEIAKLTASGHSNKEISTLLDLSVKTVETYRARGMEKLGLSCRVDLVRYAVQQGWL